MIVYGRAPLRLGLAGGGTDVSPYTETFGGLVVNATIDRFAYCKIEDSKDNTSFNAIDQGVITEMAGKNQSQLPLHAAVYARMIKEFNNSADLSLTVSTFTDSPVGAGLGASSTLVVSMIKAFDKYLSANLDNYEIARLAYSIEREDCGLSGGRQDQYSATFGGFNEMVFSGSDKTEVKPLNLSAGFVAELEASLLLFYTGVSRESAKIIDDQSKSLQGNGASLEAMHNLKLEAQKMKAALLKEDIAAVAESLVLGWQNKKKTSATVSNSTLDEIHGDAISAGALAGKVSGAGGGGFMLFLAPIEKRKAVVDALNKHSGIVSNCHFTDKGAQSW